MSKKTDALKFDEEGNPIYSREIHGYGCDVEGDLAVFVQQTSYETKIPNRGIVFFALTRLMEDVASGKTTVKDLREKKARTATVAKATIAEQVKTIEELKKELEDLKALYDAPKPTVSKRHGQ
jgi:hypothetical protein